MRSWPPPDPLAQGGGNRLAAPISGASPNARLPLPWLLFLLVFAAWYPLDPWWQSDDFIAVHYASDLGRALSDFGGNQYGLEGVVWFYRPLITLSFWVEQTLFGGPSPLVAHTSNALAHALCACLVGVLATRFFGPMRGWLAGLVWALSPSHTGAVFWAVGRVDSHTGVWMLLSCVAYMRWLDGRSRTRALTVVALVLALCSKEHALVVPGALVLLGVCAAAPGKRLRAAWWTWPTFVVAGAYLGLRQLLFGHIGGYDAGSVQPVAAAQGLFEFSLTLANPMHRMGGSVIELPVWAPWLGFVPVALALALLAWRRRFGLLAVTAVAFVALSAPTLQFWTQAGDLQSLRYFYIPFVACAFLLAAGGVVPVVLALAVFVLPTIEQHRDWFASFRSTEAMHRQLIADRTELPGKALFVAGLPRQNARGTAVEFWLGIDRLLQPPFVDDNAKRVFALRPLVPREAPSPDAPVGRVPLTVPYGDERGLPFDVPTTRFEDQTIHALLPRAGVADCRVELEGIDAIVTEDLLDLYEGRKTGAIRVRGVRAQRYRVTVFTASGYVSALVPDHAPASDADGAISILDLLLAQTVSPGRPGRELIWTLEIPVTFDLEPAFPVLVEALRDGVTTHANRRPLVLRFDRGLSSFLSAR